MSSIKGWKKIGKNTWYNPSPRGTSVTKIRINKNKPHVRAWGEYEVEGIRNDGMKLSLNAIALKEINTKAQAVRFAKAYMRKHPKV